MKKDINIVFVTIADLPEGGGNTSRLRSLLKVLRAIGYEVLVLNQHSLGISPTSKQKPSGCLEGASYSYVLGTTGRKKGVVQIYTKVRAVFSIMRCIRKLYQRDKIDILWFNNTSFYDTYPLTLQAKRLGIPTIQSYEDERLEVVTTERRSMQMRLSAIDSRLADHICPAKADAIIVISKYLEAKYKRVVRDHNRVHLLPTIIDCDEWKCPVEQDSKEPRLLYSGTFGEQDELEKLIEAFSLLRQENHKFNVTFLGDNYREPSRVDRVREIIDKYSMSSIIAMEGFVPLEKVRKYICQSNILLNIRRRGVWSMSGLSTKLSEYLASGRMVISTSVGDVPYYLEDNKNALLLSSEITAHRIAYLISRGLHSYNMRKKIGQAGREVAKKYFDLPVIQKKLQEILDDLTDK